MTFYSTQGNDPTAPPLGGDTTASGKTLLEGYGVMRSHTTACSLRPELAGVASQTIAIFSLRLVFRGGSVSSGLHTRTRDAERSAANKMASADTTWLNSSQPPPLLSFLARVAVMVLNH